MSSSTPMPRSIAPRFYQLGRKLDQAVDDWERQQREALVYRSQLADPAAFPLLARRTISVFEGLCELHQGLQRQIAQAPAAESRTLCRLLATLDGLFFAPLDLDGQSLSLIGLRMAGRTGWEPDYLNLDFFMRVHSTRCATLLKRFAEQLYRPFLLALEAGELPAALGAAEAPTAVPVLPALAECALALGA